MKIKVDSKFLAETTDGYALVTQLEAKDFCIEEAERLVDFLPYLEAFSNKKLDIISEPCDHQSIKKQP